VWAWQVTIAPSWFDPGEVPAQITPFTILYAMYDAVVRAMPGERMGNSLAESWTESPDGLVYEFKLRQGLRFHNGDPCTAEDVTFTFERYKGAGARELKDKVKQVEPAPYDPPKAKQLLAEAGYPNGLDAGELVPIPPFTDVSEAVVNYLNAVGIRVKMRTLERAAFLSAWREKKLRGVFMTAVGASGNAATRAETFMYSKATYAYGGYPDIDKLFQQQARERDRTKREALLHQIQRLTIERAMFAPIMHLRGLKGVGPRVAEHTINSIPLHPVPAFEDMRLKEP
jgi:ABC-type transport system substrate-binding protein